jgi:hypothetical protein
MSQSPRKTTGKASPEQASPAATPTEPKAAAATPGAPLESPAPLPLSSNSLEPAPVPAPGLPGLATFARVLLYLMLAAGVLGWALLIGDDQPQVPQWWPEPSVAPIWALPIAGLLVGVALTALILTWPQRGTPAIPRPADPGPGRLIPWRNTVNLTLAAGLALIVLTTLAAVGGYVNAAAAALIVVGGVSTILAAAHAAEAVRREEGISFETHWGGLGGGLGGWRISPAAALSLLTLVLASSTVAAALIDVPKPKKDPAAAPAPAAPAPAAPAEARVPAAPAAAKPATAPATPAPAPPTADPEPPVSPAPPAAAAPSAADLAKAVTGGQ